MQNRYEVVKAKAAEARERLDKEFKQRYSLALLNRDAYLYLQTKDIIAMFKSLAAH